MQTLPRDVRPHLPMYQGADSRVEDMMQRGSQGNGGAILCVLLEECRANIALFIRILSSFYFEEIER